MGQYLGEPLTQQDCNKQWYCIFIIFFVMYLLFHKFDNLNINSIKKRFLCSSKDTPASGHYYSHSSCSPNIQSNFNIVCLLSIFYIVCIYIYITDYHKYWNI